MMLLLITLGPQGDQRGSRQGRPWTRGAMAPHMGRQAHTSAVSTRTHGHASLSAGTFNASDNTPIVPFPLLVHHHSELVLSSDSESDLESRSEFESELGVPPFKDTRPHCPEDWC